ncbi:MAG: CysB family HTH-type transcriptional regulator [Betaproteobacteria bacterium]|nr:CysB family HTH-type transcriptional regulator [Betaproteobacteria bacterium]
MNLQQLRYLLAVARRGLNLSAAAADLHTSQPGISKQIRLLEDELGVNVLVRKGKRVVDTTEPGRAVLAIAERVLQDVENLKQVGREFRDPAAGTLTIATTHTQARYSLPRVVSAFKQRYPKVRLTLQQGSPPQLAEMVVAGEADIAIATEALGQYPKLLALAGYQWRHCVVAPERHPLLREKRVTLEMLARHPIVTYDPAFAGRSHIDEAFRAQGLAPDIVLSAVDSDVIKTYVELGLGIGIIAAVAFDEKRDRALRAIEAGHLFGTMTTRIAVRRGAALRGFAYAFIELFSPLLTRAVVDAALKGKGSSYEL